MTVIGVAAAAAFLTAFVLTPLLRKASHRIGYVDIPTARSSHSTPTPRTGGYAIVCGVLIGTAVAGAFHDRGIAIIAAAIVLLVLLAVIDDFYALPQWVRLVAQFVIAGAAAGFVGGALPEIGFPGGIVIPLGLTSLAVSLVWIVGVTNEFNFMDGVNGIASAEAIVCAVTMGSLFWMAGDRAGAVYAIALGAAAAGFLPWNLPSGSIFMGDTGSTPLGFSFAMLALRLAQRGVPFIAAMLPLLPFLFDATFTIVRRALRREPLLTAHRKHLYQLLNRHGWSHARVTGLWTLLAAMCGGLAILYVHASESERLASCVGILTVHGLLAWAVIRITPAAAR
jgi:UDP-N-acetylmuramyl pentapeptide phosphotransferase/UDP-N-acetylglucosamine-1-phosphate transferase